MFDPKIKIDRELYGKLKKLAGERGYSSVEEFATHILEREVSKGGRRGEAGRGGDQKEARGARVSLTAPRCM